MSVKYENFPPTLDEIIATSGSHYAGQSSFSLYRSGVKRVTDVSLVVLSLPFVLPIIIILALLIACDGGKPLYFQNRIGRGGKIYRIWKLRTMVSDADSLLNDHLASNDAARDEWNATQKLKRDPRITSFGRILRKTSLDELPQLFNVLRGDMSLVGPRPMMAEQRSLYTGTDYYDLRPGITGYWQISDRNDSEFAARVHFDTRYNADLSCLTDMKILVATVGVVLRGTGY